MDRGLGEIGGFYIVETESHDAFLGFLESGIDIQRSESLEVGVNFGL